MSKYQYHTTKSYGAFLFLFAFTLASLLGGDAFSQTSLNVVNGSHLNQDKFSIELEDLDNFSVVRSTPTNEGSQSINFLQDGAERLSRARLVIRDAEGTELATALVYSLPYSTLNLPFRIDLGRRTDINVLDLYRITKNNMSRIVDNPFDYYIYSQLIEKFGPVVRTKEFELLLSYVRIASLYRLTCESRKSGAVFFGVESLSEVQTMQGYLNSVTPGHEDFDAVTAEIWNGRLQVSREEVQNYLYAIPACYVRTLNRIYLKSDRDERATTATIAEELERFWNEEMSQESRDVAQHDFAVNPNWIDGFGGGSSNW